MSHRVTKEDERSFEQSLNMFQQHRYSALLHCFLRLFQSVAPVAKASAYKTYQALQLPKQVAHFEITWGLAGKETLAQRLHSRYARSFLSNTENELFGMPDALYVEPIVNDV